MYLKDNFRTANIYHPTLESLCNTVRCNIELQMIFVSVYRSLGLSCDNFFSKVEARLA